MIMKWIVALLHSHLFVCICAFVEIFQVNFLHSLLCSLCSFVNSEQLSSRILAPPPAVDPEPLTPILPHVDTSAPPMTSLLEHLANSPYRQSLLPSFMRVSRRIHAGIQLQHDLNDRPLVPTLVAQPPAISKPVATPRVRRRSEDPTQTIRNHTDPGPMHEVTETHRNSGETVLKKKGKNTRSSRSHGEQSEHIGMLL